MGRLISLLLSFTIFLGVILLSKAAPKTIGWCTVNNAEQKKCLKLAEAIKSKFSTKYELTCTQHENLLVCMRLISVAAIDLMTVDAGMLVYAGEYERLIPIVAEKYGLSSVRYATMVVKRPKRGDPEITADKLKGTKICSPGMGMAAGWTLPMSTLMQKGSIPITQCNVYVQTIANFFGDMCVPNVLATEFNRLGMNPTTPCDICAGAGNKHCTASDPFAGYAGAFDCLNKKGDVALLREGIVEAILFNRTDLYQDDYQLLCPNNRKAAVTDYKNCNWGEFQGDTVISYGAPNSQHTKDMRTFLLDLSMYFGATGIAKDEFQLFSSDGYGGARDINLMFSDKATELYEIGSRNTYETWVGKKYMDSIAALRYCPVSSARWCVLSPQEMTKCENMVLAFKSKELKPELGCIMADSAIDCMDKITNGDADLVTLDAADTYYAGKNYNLVPIMAEDYGDGNAMIYAIAVALKRTMDLSLFNLKQRRACFDGINMATGWVVPMAMLIETNQIQISGCDLINQIGQFFIRACAPGSMNPRYNPNTYKRDNLCEACASGGADKCQRNSRELYYGAVGAFRCMVENGGDIAFTRHTVPIDNTGGRNMDEWARNRRADDYELMCTDGTRKPIDQWTSCYMAKLRSPAIVTAGYRSEFDKKMYWQLLNFAQSFFASDTNTEFNMFDSTFNYYDLIFSDSAVRLIPLPENLQNYKEYLGKQFVVLFERINSYQCTTSGATSISFVSICLHLVVIFMSLMVLQ